MSRITNHPPEDMLLGFASGHLQDGFNLVIASHINMCKTCQKTLHLHQSVAGHIMDELTPVPMQANALDALKNLSVDTPIPVQEQKERHEDVGAALPVPLRDHIGQTLETLKWQILSRGLKQHVLKLSGSARARLIWIDKGVAVPSHGHRGDELTLVLSGGYYDGEQAFTKGHIQWADHAAPHQPIAMEDEPCLTLAVTDAPIIFQNVLPKLLQPFFKI